MQSVGVLAHDAATKHSGQSNQQRNKCNKQMHTQMKEKKKQRGERMPTLCAHK